MKDTRKVVHEQSPGMDRRRLLGSAGAGVGLLLSGCSSTSAGDQKVERCKTMKPMKRGDRIEIEGEAEAILERAYKLGYQYEKEHKGCCRCTVAALQDAVAFVPVDLALFRGSTCLDGGATPVSVQNCGAFTGSGMIIGHLCGSTRGETFEGNAALAHELLHKVYFRFKEHYGTVLCEDVRKGAEGDCPEVVGRAARWVAEVLLEEFTDYVPPEDVHRACPDASSPADQAPGEEKAPSAEPPAS